MRNGHDDVPGFPAAHRGELIDELMDSIRVHSIAGSPEHAADLLRSANWWAAALRATGFPTVEMWDAERARFWRRIGEIQED